MIGIKLELLTVNRDVTQPFEVTVYKRVPDVGWVFDAGLDFDDIEDYVATGLTDLDAQVPENEEPI